MKISIKDISINKKASPMTASKNYKLPDSIKESIKKLASGKRPTEGLTQSKISNSIYKTIQ